VPFKFTVSEQCWTTETREFLEHPWHLLPIFIAVTSSGLTIDYRLSQTNWLCWFMPKTLIKWSTDLSTIICLNWQVACYGNHIYITIHLKVRTQKSVNRVAGWPFALFKSYAVYWYMMSSAREACSYLCMLVWLH
jgi:hypothetical protein